MAVSCANWLQALDNDNQAFSDPPATCSDSSQKFTVTRHGLPSEFPAKVRLVCRHPSGILLVLCLAMLLATGAPAETKLQITRIVGPDRGQITTSQDVELTRFGEASAVAGGLQVGTELSLGDELRSRNAGVIVVAQYGEDSIFTLTNQFRAIVVPSSNSPVPFLLHLLAGSVHVMATVATGLTDGEVNLIASGTHYAFALSRSEHGLSRVVTVFDGTVRVSGPAAGTDSPVITAGSIALIAPQTFQVRPRLIMANEFRTEAQLQARVVASSAPASQREEVFSKVARIYQASLMEPTNAVLLRSAAEEQLQFVAPGTIYQIRRANQLSGKNKELKADLQLLNVQALMQLGRTQQARIEYQQSVQQNGAESVERRLTARSLDPAMFRQIRSFNPPSANPSAALIVHLTAEPPTVASGQRSRIVAKVLTGDGVPVTAAAAKIRVGGGQFANGTTVAEGTSDDGGMFATTWSCAICAAGYGFSVEVSRDGATASAETSVDVHP